MPKINLLSRNRKRRLEELPREFPSITKKKKKDERKEHCSERNQKSSGVGES